MNPPEAPGGRAPRARHSAGRPPMPSAGRGGGRPGACMGAGRAGLGTQGRPPDERRLRFAAERHSAHGLQGSTPEP